MHHAQHLLVLGLLVSLVWLEPAVKMPVPLLLLSWLGRANIAVVAEEMRILDTGPNT